MMLEDRWQRINSRRCSFIAFGYIFCVSFSIGLVFVLSLSLERANLSAVVYL